ncbi:response regulator transcription factor [Cohnella caldifontis]|uniref:response regulator transcription factor n=1 Tax=Cohnella caldifontis TaxID=3027471 RepID=UPI0023EBA8A6|nr:response regulator transcription factor [Cohnella sp. YIM B05605]
METKHNIRVFVCEDDKVYTRLLLERLGKEPDLELAGTAVSRETLAHAAESAAFDVLLLDLNLADKQMEGLEIALDFRNRYPGLKVIVLSSIEDEEIVSHMLGFGGVANYITKEFLDDIPASVRSAYFGRSGIHHSAAPKVLSVLGAQQQQELKKKISPKQLQILKLLDSGYNRREISDMLFYSEYTINNELCKVSSALKGKFPYLEWLRLKKHNSKEILELAKQLHLI